MASWTESQRRAIESGENYILCSAAAGSGKTAVMVERAVRFLREGAEPDSFLIVTFTNAAASEMKEKIRSRLYQESDHPMLRNALDRIDLIQISTIHAFCQQLIRNFFQIVEIDPNFQICDTSQRQRLFHESFARACDDLKDENSPRFAMLRRRYELRKAEQMVHSLYGFLMSLPDPFRWFHHAVAQIPDAPDPDHPWFRTLREMALDELRLCELDLSRMYGMFSESFQLDAYREAWKADAELFHVKQKEIQSPEEKPVSSEFVRLKTPRGLTVQESDWKERYQDLRNSYKKRIGRVENLLLADPEKTLADWQNLRETLEAFEELILRTESHFRLRKKSAALADLQDLEQYAVQILQHETARQEAHSIWRYVFVDECQDISAVQDEIIRLLRDPENHLFMVGDVKQSIYRFRLADPGLFLRRMEESRENPGSGGVRILLQSNFRSRPEILETTNQVFRSVMRKSVTEIDYGPEEALIPGRVTEGNDPVSVVRISRNGLDMSDLEAVAEFIGEELRDLLQTPFPGENRNYRYRDCVILMPAVQTDGALLAELLEKRQIPVFCDEAGNYYQLKEIRSVLNLLEWIEDPLQDLPLISVLLSPPFFFSEEELSRIRLRHPEKECAFYEAFSRCAEEESPQGQRCAQVLKKLRAWQSLAETVSVCDLIWELYRDTGLYYIYGADPAGEAIQANLRMLAQQAAQGESRGILTLRQFLACMRDQQQYGDQQGASTLGEQDDLVRIMTVHKSKGLQFPVVFCAGMDKSAVRGDSGGLACHARLGLCVEYKDPEHRISRPTLATELFSWKKRREEMAEKVRLLYVAMTRAQEKLYLLTCQETNPVWSMPEGDGRILSAKCYTDWWMPALCGENRNNLSTGCTQSGNPYEIKVYECNQQKTVENNGDIHSLQSWLYSVVSAPVVDDLWKNPEEPERENILIKKSVTSLVRSARDATENPEEDDEEETAEQKRMPDQLSRKLERMEMPEMPAFLREQGQMTPAWRGTLTHRILSLMDLEAMRRGVSPAEALQKEKERMIREHMASEEELKQIRDDQIISFWQQEIGRRILQSPEVRREWNFNLLIHRDRDLILQGVVDCAFREGEGWVVLDYKTDRGKTAEELSEEYRPQLMWYARAIRELTGRPVNQAALYSLSLDQLIPIM